MIDTESQLLPGVAGGGGVSKDCVHPSSLLTASKVCIEVLPDGSVTESPNGTTFSPSFPGEVYFQDRKSVV